MTLRETDISDTSHPPRRKRRWLRFSLRSLFILTTLAAIGMALIVVPAQRQKRAVAAIRSLGGSVGYSNKDKTASLFRPAWLRRILGEDYFSTVTRVDWKGSKVTDARLAHLKSLAGLQDLYLQNTQVTDAGLTQLKSLTGLRMLALDNTQVTDAGLAQLKSLTGLRVLDLDDTRVTDAGLAELRVALPNCNVFR